MDLLLGSIALTFLVTFFLLFVGLARPRGESARLVEVISQTQQSERRTAGEKWRAAINADQLAKPFGLFRSLLGGTPSPETLRRLVLAGYRKPPHADIFIGARLLLPVMAGLVVAFSVKTNTIFWFGLSVAATIFLPSFWLMHAIKRRQECIRLSLPDALDLLAVCMEAGLGMDQAIIRIGQELKFSHPELSEEFLQVSLEQRAGNPRIEAWRSMADRAGVESVRSFVNMLVQTDRFGTPISRSLGLFSDSLRTQRRQQAEELAAKTTIKLVFPLVLFIFPCIFVVTIAPAIITIMHSFGKIM